MYFSPELILSEQYSYPSDIYALGLILYELCTNECLMSMNLINKIVNEEEIEVPDLGTKYTNA